MCVIYIFYLYVIIEIYRLISKKNLAAGANGAAGGAAGGAALPQGQKISVGNNAAAANNRSGGCC